MERKFITKTQIVNEFGIDKHSVDYAVEHGELAPHYFTPNRKKLFINRSEFLQWIETRKAIVQKPYVIKQFDFKSYLQKQKATGGSL